MSQREPWTVFVLASGVKAVQTDRGPEVYVTLIHAERVAAEEAKRAALRRPVYGLLPDGIPDWIHFVDQRDEVYL
jgi:hypothetical protein